MRDCIACLQNGSLRVYNVHDFKLGRQGKRIGFKFAAWKTLLVKFRYTKANNKRK